MGNDIVIVLDSTGIKVTNRGEWLPHKWYLGTFLPFVQYPDMFFLLGITL